MPSIQRSLTNIDDDLVRQFVIPVLFVELDYPGDPVRVHDWLGEITWNGHQWTGVGNLGELKDIEETTEISNISVQLVLSGVNTDLLSKALTSNYYRRSTWIYIGMLNAATGQLTAGADILWQGYMDVMTVQVAGDEMALILTAENEDADLDRPSGTLYSNAQQQADYPGDKGFEYLKFGETQIRWPGSSFVTYANKPRGFGNIRS